MSALAICHQLTATAWNAVVHKFFVVAENPVFRELRDATCSKCRLFGQVDKFRLADHPTRTRNLLRILPCSRIVDANQYIPVNELDGEPCPSRFICPGNLLRRQ
jgi:hypothetical protein